MTDEILIVENTIEEITIEEFSGAPTGTIITSTHGMDKGDQHTIRDIVGLTTKLHDIEKLHQVRSNLGGHADYYLWGEEATEDNPLGPGYFVRLGEDGKIHKCTNETVILRPTDLTLDKDEQGQVIIYALAGNIATADINKYYVVGTQVPYDIYAYDGVEYVKKSAYSYDGEKVVKTCHTTDALGVTVSSAGFVGNDENITGTYTSAKAADVGYALVATTGVVDVLCDHSILVGDYVFPTVGGWAAKSTGSYGYLVTALVPSVNDTLYARIVLSPSMVNAKRVSDNVDYLLAETQRIGENVVKAVSDAQTALDEVRDSGNNLSDRVNNFESSMNAMGEQLYTNTVAVGNANTTAANAETIANQAKEYVQEVANSATGGASEALAIAKTLEGEMKALSEDMDTYSSKIDTIEDDQSTQATMISKANDDIAAVQTKATNLENSVTSLANKDTELANTMSLIDQKANEQGASITALTSKIDKYSVGEYSQAYGLTQAQAADILEAGKIVFIPTDFVSSDASFTEIYNPVEIETWITTDKNTKYIYSDGTYYYYHNGSQWTSISISDGQTAGYCITRFIEGYSYVWGGQKWLLETQSQNVFFTDTAPTAISTVSPLYWVVGAGYEGTDYKVGALYLYKNSAWSEVALGTSNSMSRTVALVTQTQNSWQTAISNVNGDMAALSAKVDENGSNVAMVASVVKEVKGVNLDFADNAEKIPYASINDIVSTDKTKYFVVGTKVPYDIYYYDGTTYVQKINWSYDGQRVLQPNTASIVTSANEDGSGVKIDANHINFNSDTFTVKTEDFKIDAKNIDFAGDDYKINADRIELDGSTTFSNYAQLEDVIKEQKVEYTKSTSNITLEGEVVWGSDYPIRDSGEYIWRKTTIIKGNNTELTPIIECITPADGKDGTSVAIKGTADSITQQGDLWQITYNGNIVIDAVLGDGYVYDGDLYVCVQVIDGVDLFSNVGQIQGPQGTSGASLQIIYIAQDTDPDTPTGANPTGWSPNMPTSGVIYMSQKLSNATVWSNPVRISGEKGEPGSDGVGAKYVYYLIPKDGTLPTKPIFENGALVTTTGWTEKPSGVTEQRQYEYVSVSTETEKVGDNESIQNWINFSDPVVWSKWGEKGQDGDGVEYLYCLQADNTNPPTITINYGDEPTSPWTDEPTGTSESKPYEYVVQVKSTDPKGSTYTGKLWGVYDGMMVLYCASTSIPTTPVGAGSNASTSENTKWQINIPAISGSQSIWVSYKTFLGANWSTPIKASAKDGSTGATIKSVETYYLVTKTDNAPPDPESGVEEGSGKWNTSIENWGKKDGTDIYQYLWVREKMTMDDANSTIIWTNPRLDASMTTIGQWCTENDKTIINGGNIATGSITAAQMATDAIRSQNYDGTIEDGHIIEYGTQGTMLNLKDGVFDSPHFKLNTNADFLESGNYTPNETGLKLNLSEGSIDSKNFKVNGEGAITATEGFVGGWEIDQYRVGSDVVGMYSGTEETKQYNSLIEKPAIRERELTKSFAPTPNSSNTYTVPDLYSVQSISKFEYTKPDSLGVNYLYARVENNQIVLHYNVYGYGEINYTVQYTYISDEMEVSGTSYMRFYAGADKTQPSFLVLEDGSLYAGAANITGTINTNKGHIGELEIADGGLIHTNYSLNQGGLTLTSQDAKIAVGNVELKYDDTNTVLKTSNAFSIMGENNTQITLMDDGAEENVSGIIYIDYQRDSLHNHCYIKARLEKPCIYSFTYDVKYQLAVGDVTTSNHTITKTNVFRFAFDKGSTESSNTYQLTSKAGNDGIDYMRFYNVNTDFNDWDIWIKFKPESSDSSFMSVDEGYTFEQVAKNNHIKIQGHLVPREDSTDEATGFNMGLATNQWNHAYARVGHFSQLYSDAPSLEPSDRHKKNTISTLSNDYDLIFDKLRPVTFKYNEGTSDRLHVGFIAQEVKDAVENSGLTMQDFAAYCEWEDENKNATCGLRYSEFIALCVDQIQKLKARATEQEHIINDLTNRLIALEEKSK